jgi:hypothetical protein
MNRKLILLPILVLLVLANAACADPDPHAGDPGEEPGVPLAGLNQTINTVSIPSSSLVEFTVKSLPDGMFAFEGHVFVASTNPANRRWQQAGWHVATQAIVADRDTVPADCTLYPHQGVEDQWIGSCTGNILIPQDGAEHIAVMHTTKDGTTTLIQVAPPPAVSEH